MKAKILLHFMGLIHKFWCVFCYMAKLWCCTFIYFTYFIIYLECLTTNTPYIWKVWRHLFCFELQRMEWQTKINLHLRSIPHSEFDSDVKTADMVDSWQLQIYVLWTGKMQLKKKAKTFSVISKIATYNWPITAFRYIIGF